MKMNRFIIVVSILIMSAFKGMAQNYKVIYDVFTNQTYSYQTKYKEIKDSDLNLNNEIDINYFALRNDGGASYNQLNNAIEQLALNAWQNDKSKFELQNSVKAVLANRNQFKNRNNSAFETNAYGRNNIIELKDIELNMISVCENQITFMQRFVYSVSSSSSYNSDNTVEINISNYYVADLNAQIIRQLKPKFNAGDILRLEKTLGPYINQFIKTFKAEDIETEYQTLEEGEYSDTEEAEPNEKPVATKNKKTSNVNYQEASYYWFSWGLMVEFPMFSETTFLTNGTAFTVFVPFNECRAILDLIPSYTAFKNLSKPAHNFNNFDYFEIVDNYSKFRQEPKITNLFMLNNATEKPKKLTVGSYQTFKENKKNHRANFVYEFDIKAKNFARIANNSNYKKYFENSNGKSTEHKGNAKTNESSLIYDEKGNLIIRKFNDLESGGDYIFFYNEYYAYYFRMKNLYEDKNNEFSRLSLKNGELCLKDVCLELNQKMQVSAIKSTRNQQNDTQLGFDNKDRLVEGHVENDRYNYYYEYDASDRLIKYSFYEYSRLEKEVEFFYLDQNRLPYLQKKHSVNNDTFEEETYDWEY